ncbi:MAG: FAD-binding oxidoreductase [Candidatus Nanopelagicales bacterium]|jgi:alkyldihydroxyacetonephosphate synthase|nr:FAD-binding oxidoreductase [Candidatus Nanopelagicales bacterium]
MSDRWVPTPSPVEPGRWARQVDGAELDPQVGAYLREHVGIATPWPMPDVEAAQAAIVPRQGAAVVPDQLLRGIGEAIGAAHVSVDPLLRTQAAVGASYTDYARRRSGAVTDVPDAVVSPANHEQTQAVVDLCSDAGVAVVPWGGGTSVVGGLSLSGPRIAISTRRMRHISELDHDAGLVTVGAGLTGPALEAAIGLHGFTLGHLPQSWEQATMGGYVATRSAGQASSGYGRVADMVEGLRLATPRGDWQLGHSPASAAGPDLLHVAIGSEGRLGVITEVTLRLRRLPTSRRYEAVIFPRFIDGVAAFRDLAQTGLTADVMRLSDPPETATSLLMSAPDGLAGTVVRAYMNQRGITERDGCLAIMGWESSERSLQASRRSAAWRVLRRFGAVTLGAKAGESWRRKRFHGPHLRDTLMDAGYLVETLETATTWSNLVSLRASIHRSIDHSLTTNSTTPYVMTHISHVYDSGASLYTTVIAVANRTDPVGQWRRTKAEVTDVIMDGGGTVTHHHAVGRDHAPWLNQEIGDIGVDVLRAIARTLDPQGICNPGVLFADSR